jgi:alanine racemase
MNDLQPYSTWVEVDLEVIRQNLHRIKTLTESEVMAVVKANAYGHGFLPVAQAAAAAGATWFGIARPRMALAMRQSGIEAKILILGYISPERVQEMLQIDVSLTVWTADHIHQIAQEAAKTRKTARVHILTDTGMGRLGCLPEKTKDLLKLVQETPQITAEGLFSHLATADEADSSTTLQQEKVFRQVQEDLRDHDLLPSILHLANSAGSLVYPSAHYNLIRVGIAMYGLSPSSEVDLPVGIKPALEWKSVLASIKTLPAGHGVSYGHQYFTSSTEKIGVVPLGYADGYRRVPGNHVLIQGQKVPVVGRVCMDQCMVQLDGISNPQVGDEVILIGSQGDQEISADDLARTWDTINYEVTCGIGARVPRIFKN